VKGDIPAPTPPQPLRISDVLREWIAKNEAGLNGFVGQGRITIVASFNTAANNGAGEVRILLGS